MYSQEKSDVNDKGDEDAVYIEAQTIGLNYSDFFFLLRSVSKRYKYRNRQIYSCFTLEHS